MGLVWVGGLSVWSRAEPCFTDGRCRPVHGASSGLRVLASIYWAALFVPDTLAAVPAARAVQWRT